MKRRFVTATALIGAASMLMAACSQGGSASSEAGTSLTLRLWDDQAAQAYEAALPEFTEETGITVNVEVVPWSDYFTGLRSELAAGTGPDVFWSNTNNYTEYARGGKIVNIDEEFPASEREYTGFEDGFPVPPLPGQTPVASPRGLTTIEGELAPAAAIDSPKESTDE